LEHTGETRALGYGVPVDDDELGRELKLLALLGEAVDENLGADERVAAVIVVARGADHGEIWLVSGG
jgi:hypothetical protein